VPAVWDPYERDRMGDADDFRVVAGWNMVRWLNRQTGWRRILAKSLFLAPLALVILIVIASLIL
jgi:hypothetical protein